MDKTVVEKDLELIERALELGSKKGNFTLQEGSAIFSALLHVKEFVHFANIDRGPCAAPEENKNIG